MGLEYEYLGEHQVKNIEKPVRAYRVLSFPGLRPTGWSRPRGRWGRRGAMRALP